MSSTACAPAPRCCSTSMAAKPNGFGIVFVAGSGFHADAEYGARPLKDTQIDLWGPPLTAAGYTVFAINHRGAPGSTFPRPRRRAARHPLRACAGAGVRHRWRRHLGGLGGSSGGNLIALAGCARRRERPTMRRGEPQPATLQPSCCGRQSPTCGPCRRLKARISSWPTWRHRPAIRRRPCALRGRFTRHPGARKSLPPPPC